MMSYASMDFEHLKSLTTSLLAEANINGNTASTTHGSLLFSLRVFLLLHIILFDLYRTLGEIV